MDDWTTQVALALYVELFQSSPENYIKALNRIDFAWMRRINPAFQKAFDIMDDRLGCAKLLLVFAVGMWEKGYNAASVEYYLLRRIGEEDDSSMPQLR